MPPKQVYGKRARAIYDPFQAFASPQRPKPKDNINDQAVFVAEVVEELSRLKVQHGDDAQSKRKYRAALGERSVNERAKPVNRTSDKAESKQRRRKVKEKAEDTDDATAMSGSDSKETQKRSRRREQTVQGNSCETNAATPDLDFAPDNVPMFVDGHGYETEGEHVDNEAHVNSPATVRRPEYHGSQESETPSISILPPTPPSEEDEYVAHCAPLLQHSHSSITNFAEWSNQLVNHFSITKIAEASFGEVYRLSLLEDLSSFAETDESVLKIIALKPPESKIPSTSKKKEHAAALKKVDAMSKVEDVANEVKLLQRMSTIPGFTNFRDVRIMRGRPSQPFVKAFKDFNVEQKARKKDPSVFPDPAKKASYAEDQLWAVIEMQDAGDDLERRIEQGRCQSIWSVWDIFWQVVLTLAKGEEGAEFEHRDLHLGNVCVRQLASCEDEPETDTERKLGFTNLETTIIDYTISRALLSSVPTKDIAYHDLSTKQCTSIFEGDSTEEYQYDIYRYMRGCVLAADPYHIPPPHSTTSSPSPSSSWSAYHPRTNLIWTHFLLHSLLEQLAWPSATKAPPRKRNDGRDHARWKHGNDLEHVLLRVQELLDPAAVCAPEGLASAGALVGLALSEGWLDVGDVVGGDESAAEGNLERELVEGVDGLDVNKAVGEADTLARLQEPLEDGARDRKPERSRGKRG